LTIKFVIKTGRVLVNFLELMGYYSLWFRDNFKERLKSKFQCTEFINLYYISSITFSKEVSCSKVKVVEAALSYYSIINVLVFQTNYTYKINIYFPFVLGFLDFFFIR